MPGLSYNWDQEVDATNPRYFKWTQWMFLVLYGTWYDAEANKGRAENVARSQNCVLLTEMATAGMDDEPFAAWRLDRQAANGLRSAYRRYHP
jgi:leucyl-tRNA synthetase